MNASSYRKNESKTGTGGYYDDDALPLTLVPISITVMMMVLVLEEVEKQEEEDSCTLHKNAIELNYCRL